MYVCIYFYVCLTRYQRPFPQHDDDKSPDSDMDSSYFRRQPASILSTAKTPDTGSGGGGGSGITGAAPSLVQGVAPQQRYSWMGVQSGVGNENVNFTNDPR